MCDKQIIEISSQFSFLISRSFVWVLTANISCIIKYLMAFYALLIKIATRDQSLYHGGGVHSVAILASF